jgi:D-alanyl-D-alanine dipeptidase
MSRAPPAGAGAGAGVILPARRISPWGMSGGDLRPTWRGGSASYRGSMTILLSDPRVAAIPVVDRGESLSVLAHRFGPARAAVRSSLADRLEQASRALPAGVALRVVEGHRSIESQRDIIRRYGAELSEVHPGIGPDDLRVLTSRYVSPVEVAPHVAGAAVDVTLVDGAGRELDMGTPLDATPEQSGGDCYFDAPRIGRAARANRAVLAGALAGAGLVNYPTEWWHWSYGDRYWALVTGAAEAAYGPVLPHRPAS